VLIREEGQTGKSRRNRGISSGERRKIERGGRLGGRKGSWGRHSNLPEEGEEKGNSVGPRPSTDLKEV